MASEEVKCTNGVIRRVDKLGRTVMGKEYRDFLRIREGDLVEQFLVDGTMVCIRKFSPIKTLKDIAADNAKILHQMIQLPVLVADTERVLIAEGVAAPHNYLNRTLTDRAAELIYGKTPFLTGEQEQLKSVDKIEERVLLQVPIVTDEMVGGAVIVLADKADTTLDSSILELTCMAAKLISARMDWGFA